jgi:hypothetical protein
MLQILLNKLRAWMPRRRVNVLFTVKPLAPGRYTITVANMDTTATYWKVLDGD